MGLSSGEFSSEELSSKSSSIDEIPSNGATPVISFILLLRSVKTPFKPFSLTDFNNLS